METTDFVGRSGMYSADLTRIPDDLNAAHHRAVQLGRALLHKRHFQRKYLFSMGCCS
jgi:hypothetical protein